MYTEKYLVEYSDGKSEILEGRGFKDICDIFAKKAKEQNRPLFCYLLQHENESKTRKAEIETPF